VQHESFVDKPEMAMLELSGYASLYRHTLLDDVIPFWMRHALGAADGAINNCLDDDGRLMSTDRYLWSQGRALWTFSALYNRIEKRPKWLEVASRIAHYLYTHGRDEQGRWMYRLDAHGNVLQADESIYVDGFVMNGLGEYFLASGDNKAAQIASETFTNVWTRLQNPGSYRVAPYEIPMGSKVLGIRMLFSMVFDNLGKALARDDMRAVAVGLADELLTDFKDPARNIYHEIVGIEGKLLDTPASRVCLPGHVIEAMWFLIAIFEHRRDRMAQIQKCCDIIHRHLELAWDDEFGGLRLAIDAEGKEPVAWAKPDCKPWWVHVEALVATAYAHLYTGEAWCMVWHDKVREYAFSHYPVPTGEWTQWLDRQGNKTGTAALPVKDPFHLPRALMYLIALFESMSI
jgi:N-acylglucosamine 2-epimerase